MATNVPPILVRKLQTRVNEAPLGLLPDGRQPSLPIYSQDAGANQSFCDQIPATGVPYYDELAVKTSTFRRFRCELARKGIHASPVQDLRIRAVFRQFNGAVILEYNPGSFTRLDVLHEWMHLRRGLPGLGTDAIIVFLDEIRVYGFEITLGKQRGFTDAYLSFAHKTREEYRWAVRELE